MATKNGKNGKSVVPAGDKITTLEKLFEEKRGAIQKAAPPHMNVERLFSIAAVSIRRNPKLLDCSQASIMTAVFDAARYGLIPDSLTQEGHLIPFWDKHAGGFECQFMVGYKGLIKLAMNSGLVADVDVQAVYENDEFSYHLGLKPDLTHIPAEDDPGEFKGAYAIVHLKSGRSKFHYVSAAKGLEHAKRFTKSKDKKTGEIFGIWETDFPAMCMKTALRKALKYCPLSSDLDAALHSDEIREAGGAVPMERPAIQMPQRKALNSKPEPDPEPEPEGEKKTDEPPTPGSGSPEVRSSETTENPEGAAKRNVITRFEVIGLENEAQKHNVTLEEYESLIAGFGFKETRDITRDKLEDVAAALAGLANDGGAA